MDDAARRRLQEPALKAPSADQKRLLDVQALDTKIAQLAHRRATLPEHAKLVDVTQRQDALRDQLVGVRTEESDLDRELRKA